MAGSDTSVDPFQDYINNICNSDAGFWLEMLTDSRHQSDAQFNSELQDKQLKAWPSFRDDQLGSGFEQQPSRCSTVNSASDLPEALTTISADLTLSLSLFSSFSDSSSEKSDPDNPREIADTPGTHSSLVERNGNHMLPSDSNINEIQIESTLDTGEGLRKVNFPVPEVGMEFCSEEDAYNFYVSYAKQIGFRVRKGKVQRSSNGDIRKRYFFCSREGFRLKKQSNKKTKYNRKETRTGCNAKIECTVESGKWVVSRFFEEHNHDLEDHMNVESQTRRSGTRLVINLNNEASMEPVAEATNFVKSYSIDCIAHVRDTKAYGLKPENAQNLINYLRRLQAEDPSFFHTVQLDADCRFTNIFWRDGRSKGDYDYFGDVIILDTTFKLDKYGMICAPFMGINHHRQFILFGCAFLLDESTDSFIWLLETFMEAMGRRQPKTIITDEGQAMVDAVKLMMPEARHQIGLWYIHRNASMHLSSCFEQPGLKKLFGECISECETEEEFESRWTSLLEKFHLRGNEWLANLHSSRDRWCHIFSRKTFSAGIQCYARIDSVFQNLAGHSDTMRLSAYVEQYFRAAKQQRREELYEDSHCNETEADMILDSCPAGLSEKQAASLYTCTMFKLFQKQLPMFLLVTVLEVTDDGRIATYKLSEAGKKKAFFVELNCLDSTIACCCKKYESDGILCVHALKVLIERNIYEIPPQYILKRWTKSAKDVAVAVYHGKALNTTAKSAAVLENKRSKCVSVLKQRINRVSEPGSADGPSRGFDVNRLSAEETEEGAALSSPNSAASSFQMDFEIISSSGGDRSHERDFEDVETQRASSRASDDEENGLTRKKLRLTKEQSAFLEGSFKEHSTLNPKQKFALAKQLNLLPS